MRLAQQLRPALVLVAAFTVLFGLAFPAAFVGLGRAALPFRSGGSLVERDGRVVGSALLGQSFSSDRYFHGRPSATTDTDPADAAKTVAAPYNAANSAGSNLAPTSRALRDRVAADIAGAGPAPVPGVELAPVPDVELAPVPDVELAPVPGDAVTASASGLDPHISPAYAERQVPRVAAARKLPEARVRELVAAHTAGRFLGIVGEPRVDVLALNLALDAAAPAASATASNAAGTR